MNPRIIARVMNAGTAREFVRIFAECPMGHDLGSIPLGSLQEHDWEIRECHHYEHKAVA